MRFIYGFVRLIHLTALFARVTFVGRVALHANSEYVSANVSHPYFFRTKAATDLRFSNVPILRHHSYAFLISLSSKFGETTAPFPVSSTNL